MGESNVMNMGGVGQYDPWPTLTGSQNPFSSSKPGGAEDMKRRKGYEVDLRSLFKLLVDPQFTIPGTREAMGTAGEMGQMSRALAGQGQDYLGDIAPVRKELGGILTDVLRGGRPEAMRVFAPEREALEAQFGRARENVMTNSPVRGGQLGRALIDLDTQRALGIGQQEADVRRQAMAMSLGFGSNVSPGLSALQGAGGLMGGSSGLYQGLMGQHLARLLGASDIGAKSSDRSTQAQQAKKQSVGSAAGSGAALAMCWVAAALYGWESPEWAASRRAVSRWPWWGQRLYRLLGPAVGGLARRWPRLRTALRRPFDRLVLQGARG